MSSHLPSLSSKDVFRILRRAGFLLRRQSGSHAHFRHRDDPTRRVTVPVHPGDLKTGVLFSILRQSRLKPEEFLSFL